MRNRGDKWTNAEAKALRVLSRIGITKSANRMDRAYNTVWKHAKRLGLKFDRDREARLRHKQWDSARSSK